MEDRLSKISQLEKKYEFVLPLDYKEFISNHNGEDLERDTFYFRNSWGEEEDSVVHYFFLIDSENDYDDFESEYEFWVVDERLPKDVIPIARDPFGNLICISVSEDSYGKVLFWDHEKDDDECFSIIADSFTEFYNMLE
ncbi:SMI1/KNR4 family protein [Acetivibrio clariflavus]|uniref:Putative glucan synthasis protein n=2 Tax=Acetivibrio clariflavus TaxID=288965 RepID=G8LYH0_ACECE|nr:SMI1/KNR4 family protein [Acetivibrio clariflavus]AEV68939.1 putative glucan synthasis protein [Acetivibrio clariflavus DSM 19732]